MAGVATLLLLARLLSPQDYAAYVAVWASVEIVLLLSNFGLMHAAYRYVQSVELGAGRLQIQGPVGYLLLLRALSLPLGAILLVVLWPGLLAGTQSDAEYILQMFALIACAEGMARYCELLFESLQLQWRAQLTTLLRTVLKPLGFALLAAGDVADLRYVLAVELLACASSAVLGLGALLQLHLRSERVPPAAQGGASTSLGRMLNFVLPAYLTQLLGLSFGPDVLKLILSKVGDPIALAVFGFAFALAAMLQRYLPVNIFGGVLRPLFVAAEQRADADELLSRLVAFVTKLNWLFVVLPMVVLAPLAPQVVKLLSHGRYADAGQPLMLLLAGMLAASAHGVLSLYCLARENSRSPLLATVCAALTLPLSYLLAARGGAAGLALAWLCSELVWVLVCATALGLLGGTRKRLDLARLLRVPLIAGLVIAAGLSVAAWLPAARLAAALAAPLLLVTMYWRAQIFDAQERAWMATILPQRLRGLLAGGAA